MIEIGTRVSYEDIANPLREGTIVGEIAGQWAITWDDVDTFGAPVKSDTVGVAFHTTVTKHMLENAATRQATFRAEGRGHRCGGWDVMVDDGGAAAIEWLSDTTGGGDPDVDEAPAATTTYTAPTVHVQSSIEASRHCIECGRRVDAGARFVRRVATRTITKAGERTRTVNVVLITHLRECTSDTVLAAIEDENVTPHALNTLDNERARRARVGVTFDVAQVGGAFDGFTVTSDADSGL